VALVSSLVGAVVGACAGGLVQVAIQSREHHFLQDRDRLEREFAEGRDRLERELTLSRDRLESEQALVQRKIELQREFSDQLLEVRRLAGDMAAVSQLAAVGPAVDGILKDTFGDPLALMRELSRALYRLVVLSDLCQHYFDDEVDKALSELNRSFAKAHDGKDFGESSERLLAMMSGVLKGTTPTENAQAATTEVIHAANDWVEGIVKATGSQGRVVTRRMSDEIRRAARRRTADAGVAPDVDSSMPAKR
jgi:hypothetical protein